MSDSTHKVRVNIYSCEDFPRDAVGPDSSNSGMARSDGSFDVSFAWFAKFLNDLVLVEEYKPINPSIRLAFAPIGNPFDDEKTVGLTIFYERNETPAEEKNRMRVEERARAKQLDFMSVTNTLWQMPDEEQRKIFELMKSKFGSDSQPEALPDDWTVQSVQQSHGQLLFRYNVEPFAMFSSNRLDPENEMRIMTDVCTVAMEDLDVMIQGEFGDEWRPAMQAFDARELIPNNIKTHFRKPMTEDEREWGYY